MKIPEYNTKCTEAVKALGIDFSINLEDDTVSIMTGTDKVEDMWKALLKQYESKGLNDVIQKVNNELK